MSKYSITDDSHLTTLDGALKDNLYIGGHAPNAEDTLVYEQYVQAKSEPNQDKHLNLWSWFALVTLFGEHIRQSWAHSEKQQAPKKETKKEAPKPKAEVVDECDDLFGEDTEEDKAKLQKMKDDKEAEKKVVKKEKAPLIQKSIVLLEVKVWEMEQDLDALALRVIAVEKEGLMWKTEYKLEEVAFGMKMIIVGLVIEDEKVSIDDLIEELQAWEDDIQSVDIRSFNKI
jgi:elongation factor 1-beta